MTIRTDFQYNCRHWPQLGHTRKENDDERNAETIKKETGANIYKLNSCLNGNLEKDSYINAMNENLEIFKEMLK